MRKIKSRRTKAYQPKWNGDGRKLRTMPWKVASVFGPMEAIIDQLEQDGTVDAVDSGAPVFRDFEDGGLYDTCAAFTGVIDAYAIHEIRSGQALDLAPLRQLVNKLQYGMPIFDTDTRAVRACLARMKATTAQMTEAYADQLYRDYAIKNEIEKATSAATPNHQHP
ncbi:hypothetical protein [Herminiimonas sp. CN]|uniref:hypothetical protein n=1 Tax=Herminiimonas sp. CN TaxID=1349818 RepID=UPI0012DF9287|nr:hypothetical protein [Herminiimonas sp. CN]